MDASAGGVHDGPQREIGDGALRPWLSVVVIGRNEGDRLARCLDSVMSMHLPGPGQGRDGVGKTTCRRGCASEQFARHVEVIYVDSGSTDGSLGLAEVKGARTLALSTGRPTAARGRNAGWRAARAETVLFLDGDTVLHPDFAVKASAVLCKDVAVVWGHRRELFPERSVYNRVLDLDWVYAPGDTAFCGGDALFQRAALEEAGGFDEGLIAGEEPELCRRLLANGNRIVHVDMPMTGHDLGMVRFGQYWRRAMRAGHAYGEVAERFRDSDNPFWSAEVEGNRRRALFLIGVLVGGLLMSLMLASAKPLTGSAAVLALLAARTAWKARWKSRNVLTLLLYGVHAHLQQIPIYLGHLQFRRNRRVGRVTGLVEYK